MGFALAATGFGPQDIHLNGPYSVAFSIGFLSLLSVFASTVLSAPALLRDTEHRMAEIVYATSVTKRDYILGRFTGSFLAVAAAFACSLIGLVAGAFLVRHDAARLGPFDAFHYLWSLAVMGLPGMLFVAALLFAVAALTRSTLATYAAGTFLYVLYFAAALIGGSPLMAGTSPPSPEGMAVAALADPFGLTAFFEQTHYWTAAERNVRNVALTGHFLWNRVLFTAAAVLVLELTRRRFAFRVSGGARSGRRPEDDEPRRAADGAAAAAPSAVYRPVPARAGRALSLAALQSATRMELRALLLSWPFAALLMLYAGGALVEMVQTFRTNEFGTALVPTTPLVIACMTGTLGLFGTLLLVYYGAELVWRERAARIAEVVDATPAPNALFLLAKGAALSIVSALLVTLAIGLGVLFQLASGYRVLEPALYASVFYFTGLPLVLVAVLALFIQTLSPNRHVGMLVTLLAVLVLHRGLLGGPQHPLLRYAAAPEVPISAIAGFGPEALSFGWFMAYWSAVAALIALVAGGLWRRGTDARLSRRLAALPRSSRTGRLAALASTLAALVLGVLVFRQTNVWNIYESPDAGARWKADYERTYRGVARVPQPTIAHMSADVDLFPGERRIRAHGTYRLENRTPRALATVFLSVRRDASRAAMTLGGSPPSAVDARFGMRRFDLASPMAPGSARELAFDVTIVRRGAKAGSADRDILENGSYIWGHRVLPSVGYRDSYELSDRAERRKHGLPERDEALDADADAEGSSSRMTYDVTVSAPADQTPVVPGVLVDSRLKDGRRFSRFSVDHPVTPALAFAAARFSVERFRHAGVDVEVLFHPAHGRNVVHIVEAAKASLDYCISQFGPYPLPQLRIAEATSYALSAAGFALPGVVYLNENRAYLTDLSDPERVDVVTKRVAHEIAHQWWGHQLTPDEGPGASALVESLARYSELRVLKARQGEDALRPILAVELDRYLSGRTGGDEVPLDRVGRQPYLYYAKGALVMAALADLIGEEAVNRGLRELLVAAQGSSRSPTSRDLLEHLRAVTPAEHRQLLDQWWTRIVLYDLRVASAAAERLSDGRTRVDIEIEAAKTDATGPTPAPLEMDEMLDVVVTSAYPGGRIAKEELLHSGRHRIQGRTRLSIVVDGTPRYVAIDPYLRRIDRDGADNVRKIEVSPPRARAS